MSCVHRNCILVIQGLILSSECKCLTDHLKATVAFCPQDITCMVYMADKIWLGYLLATVTMVTAVQTLPNHDCWEIILSMNNDHVIITKNVSFQPYLWLLIN